MPGQIGRFAEKHFSARTRWWLLLLVLVSPLLLSIIGAARGHHPSLPHTIGHAILYVLLDILLWSTVFILAFRIAGVTAKQLRVKMSNPWRTIAFGFGWFVLIRILVALIFWIAARWIDPTAAWATEEKIAHFTGAKNITQHLPLSIAIFALSSITAGFSEELWRAGTLAGIQQLFPRFRITAVILLVSVLFALAHLYQGAFGMVNALLLGVMLGSVMVYRNSYAEAAIAHMLFDALSFGLATTLIVMTHNYSSIIVYEAAQGNLPKLKHWVALGGDVNATYSPIPDWKNITALQHAADRPHHAEVVRFLLENGADPNLADSRGRTPLIAAAEQDQLDNVEILLTHGASLNDQDNRGFTALLAAVEYNHLEVARALIASGADVNIKGKDGLSPLGTATKYGYGDLKNFLQQSGGK